MHIILAITLDKLNKFVEALEFYDLVIQKIQTMFIQDLHKSNYFILSKIKKRVELKKHCNTMIRLLKKNSEDSEYYNRKTGTLDRMTSFEEALEYYDLGIQKNLCDLTYFSQRGKLQYTPPQQILQLLKQDDQNYMQIEQMKWLQHIMNQLFTENLEYYSSKGKSNAYLIVNTEIDFLK